MTTLRVIGLAMVLYGALMLVLLVTPYRNWALDHSIAEVVSNSDRRASNQMSGSADMPIAIAGSAVVMFAGLWIGLLIPWVMNRHHRSMMEAAGFGDDPTE